MSNNIVGFKEVTAADLFIKDPVHPATPRSIYYPLHNGDIITVDSIRFEHAFGVKVNDVKVGKYFDPGFVLLTKIKRKKWYQFWKPKYFGARLMFVKELEK